MKKWWVILIIITLALIVATVVIKNGKEVAEIEMVELKITSPAFEHNGSIPEKYTCDGSDISPPLEISGVPAEAKSLVLINDDPDAPVGTWDHWIVFNIPPTTTEITENSVPGTQGKNSFRKLDYGGPCPPSGEHRYFFKLYALDTELDIGEESSKPSVESAMEGHILAQGELVGKYSRD